MGGEGGGRSQRVVVCTSKSPLLLMQGREQRTMTRRVARRRTPVSPAVPHTQPTSVPTKSRYCQTGYGSPPSVRLVVPGGGAGAKVR